MTDSTKTIQYVKDCCHLHKLEDEYKQCERISQAKYEELRRWIAYCTFTYPEFRKDL